MPDKPPRQEDAAVDYRGAVYFRPISGPEVRSGRRIGPRENGDSGGPRVTDPAASTFGETLLRQLWWSGTPARIKKRYVCTRGHTLMWIVQTDWGLVPIADRKGRGHASLRTSGDIQGPPMTLEQWPAGEHLPIASCACHDEVVVSLHQARSWFEPRDGAPPRDKFVHSP